MTEPVFNLIDEPWVIAVTKEGKTKQYGLRNLFREAHNISFLAGETPLQDTAILRLLIAISITCFYRYDENGGLSELADEQDAIDRYRTIWNNGAFPDGFIDNYLSEWHDRFYLCGGERPFYQVPSDKCRCEKTKRMKDNPTGLLYHIEPYEPSDKLGWVYARSFNGEILESNNSSSPFANKSGEAKLFLSYDATARWLVYYMNFADCSSKIPGKWNAKMTFASSGANIHPIGKNLFETIMLCSALLKQETFLYGSPAPLWESDHYTRINSSPYGEGRPDNIPELYTQQSRKVILHEENGRIDGMFAAAGDRYGTKNAFEEPMFSFHQDNTDKSGNTYRPNHIAPSSSGWKEFIHIFGDNKNVTRWIDILFENDILPENINIPFVMTDIGYGSMQCGVKYTVNTRVTVNEKFFIDNQELDRAKIEIRNITKISGILYRFGREIEYAYGAKTNEKNAYSIIGQKSSEEYEVVIGGLFEQFLVNKVSLEDLKQQEIKTAEKVAENILKNENIVSITGHGEKSLGTAEDFFHSSMWNMKKQMGLIKEGGEQ